MYKLYASPEYTRAFFNYVIEPLQKAGVDIEKALDGLSFYIGQNPANGGINANLTHYDSEKRYIVKPRVEFVDDIPKETQLQVYFHLFFHEIGHDVHVRFLGEDKKKWEEWAKLTGNQLDLNWRSYGDYHYAISCEKFANDFASCITENLPNKRKYYYSLWGQILQDEIKLKIGSNKAWINGLETTLDAPPKIEEGRTLVPLRFVAEALGCNVQWNSDTQEITIRRG